MVMSLSEDKREIVKSLLSYSSLGLEMGLCVAIGIGIGYFLDKYFQNIPLPDHHIHDFWHYCSNESHLYISEEA